MPGPNLNRFQANAGFDLTKIANDTNLKTQFLDTASSTATRYSAPHLTVTCEDKVRFLSKPESYSIATKTVDIVETHMAWVFLTVDFAFKLKKPVARPHLDFSTIDARHRDHLAELALNRRLNADIYLSVVALTVDGGALSLAGTGQPCEWLLKMRRLPAERALNVLLGRRVVSPPDVRAIAEKLAAFYLARQPVAMSIYEYRDRFERNIAENENVLVSFGSGLFRKRVKSLVDRQLAFILRRRGLFDDCVFRQRIIEGHGDLRPEHIWLDESVHIIDCLEFWRDFRLLDYYDDLAFLALECERLAMPRVGNDIVEAVIAITGERPAMALMHFYQSYRAAIRAKLAVWHLLDEYDPNIEKWLRAARVYLDLADRHMELADYG